MSKAMCRSRSKTGALRVVVPISVVFTVVLTTACADTSGGSSRDGDGFEVGPDIGADVDVGVGVGMQPDASPPTPADLAPCDGLPSAGSGCILVDGLARPTALALVGDELVVLDGDREEVLGIDRETGATRVIAACGGRPTALAVGPSRVFWSTEEGEISWVDREVGGAPSLLAVEAGEVMDMAVGGDYLWWTDRAGDRVLAAAISELPAAPDGDAEPGLLFAPNQDNPFGVVYLDGFVYWTNVGGQTRDRGGYLMRRAVVDGSVEALYRHPDSGGSWGLTQRGSELFWLQGFGYPESLLLGWSAERMEPTRALRIGRNPDIRRLAVGESVAAWTSPATGDVFVHVFETGQTTLLVDGRVVRSWPYDIAIAGDDLYWTDSALGAIVWWRP